MKGLANPPYTRTKIECFQRVETSHAEIFKKDVIEVVTDEMPAGEAIMDRSGCQNLLSNFLGVRLYLTLQPLQVAAVPW